jgi:3-hydroxyisobutyrate dehydrogenase-like beta-hydroxyacid dehydrogenase
VNVATAPAFGLPGRIQAPNSRRRAIAVIGLGRGGATIAERLRRSGPRGIHVLDATRREDGDALAAIRNNGNGLRRAIAESDLVFVAARGGDELAMLPVVHRLAAETRTQLMVLYLVEPGPQRSEDDAALAQLRRAAHMLVVSSDETYIEAMVAALCGAEQEITE